MNIAIIPARGNSKRIKKKNIKDFLGKPIIYYSINAAIESKLFDRIIVSTDCQEIATISESLGASIPFIRPKSLADDYTSILDVVLHAEEYLSKKNEDIKTFCCLYATSPLLKAESIIKGYNLLKQSKETDVTFSASKFSYPVQRSFLCNNSMQPKLLFEDCYHKRSQDLEPVYHDSGQFFWWKPGTLSKNSIIFNTRSKIVEIDESKTQDIDTLEDWKIAEIKFQAMQKAE